MENTNSKISRRKFFGTSATALVTTTLVTPGFSSCTGSNTTNSLPVEEGSKFSGVQIGTITYSWRTMPGGLDNIIKYCKTAGISSIELMSGDLEQYMGLPENPLAEVFRDESRDPAAQPKPNQEYRYVAVGSGYIRVPYPFTAEQQAAVDKYNADIKEWRINLPMSKAEEARTLLKDNGIQAHIVKFSPARWSDEEIDYAFKVAKAMGAKAVTEEISLDSAKKLAPFAEKHNMYVGMHNHMQYAEPDFDVDAILAVNPTIMLNFDAGHYYGSTGKNPCDFVRKYHDRIYSIHIKDKTGPTTDPANANQVFGQGETPIAELLKLLQQEKWPIYVDIELEYPIAPWSTAEKEVATCVDYLRQILV
ncbi:sugar phosphate isomerase/epimerase family protein [Massilibacteroides vaginae]|uniref:sugar phosphate isomerase/epimerase family protein n=1 Tax=Massilibacteroides vaginae TaxID=1673718 RepID=UPI001FE27BD6|nr:sugar phosphate isomerase/epimerase [Massilibacteroides vaginae]